MTKCTSVNIKVYLVAQLLFIDKRRIRAELAPSFSHSDPDDGHENSETFAERFQVVSFEVRARRRPSV